MVKISALEAEIWPPQCALIEANSTSMVMQECQKAHFSVIKSVIKKCCRKTQDIIYLDDAYWL